MKAIHKLEQNEFHAQKKSILIVASFLLHCNLSAKQNAVTSHRSLRALCSPKQYLFPRGPPQLNQIQEQHPVADSENKAESSAAKARASPKPSTGEPHTPHRAQNIPGGPPPLPLLLLKAAELPDPYLHKQTDHHIYLTSNSDMFKLPGTSIAWLCFKYRW